MMRVKKHWGFLKGAAFTFLLLAAIATPISLSLAAPSLATPNIAYAAVCPAGFQDMPLPNGTVACKGTPGAEMPLGGTTPTGMYVTLGDQDVAINANGETLDRNGQVINSDTGQAVNAGAPAVCTGIVSCLMWLPTALWKVIVTLLAGSLIYISTWMLAAAASLFNWLVDNTIIQFGAFYGTIKPAVETAWTAFRDIANIFIIGIFTFVAISIILGLKEFGQKKMIASVLIVAVLINFSLLFTKMIIDVSNFAAAQVYTAAALGGSTAGQGAPIGSASAVPKYGIADQFMYLLGVGTFSDAYKIVNDTAQAKDSGWAALLHGILVFAVVIGAALVLFYGSFLLVSRMIMLIFLMATAAIAVASYLIPDWGTSNYGFKAWKSSLIWCATLAPMLMVFLWMTLNVSYALKGTSKATLGAALSNPAGGENIVALFNYVLVLGLLFTTFKLSSMWASKIGGFSFAAAPLTNAFRAAGLGMRLGVGLPAYFYGKRRIDEAKKARDDGAERRMQQKAALNRGDQAAATRFGAEARNFENLSAAKLKSAGIANKLASSRFNLMDTAGAKAILGATGIKGAAAGESSKFGIEKSITDRVKMRAEAAEKMAAKIAPSAEQNNDAKIEARRVIREQRQVALQQLEATRDQAKQTQNLEGKLTAAVQSARTIEADAVQNQTRIQLDPTLSAADRDQQMRDQDQRITDARRAVTDAQTRINTFEQPVKDFEARTEELAKDAGDRIVAAMRESGINVAERVGAKQGDILTRNTIGRLGENKLVADETKSLYKKKVKTASFRDAIKLTEEEEGGGGAAAAPAAPHP